MTENSSGQSFYPLTTSISRKLYRAKLSAGKWRLWTYLSIDPWGNRYANLPDTPLIFSKISINKSTFCKAIAKFQKLKSQELSNIVAAYLAFNLILAGEEHES